MIFVTHNGDVSPQRYNSKSEIILVVITAKGIMVLVSNQKGKVQECLQIID